MRDGGFQSVQFVSGICHHHTPCTCGETIGKIVIIIIIIINDNIIIIITKTGMVQKQVQPFDGLFDCLWLVVDIYLAALQLGKYPPLQRITVFFIQGNSNNLILANFTVVTKTK